MARNFFEKSAARIARNACEKSGRPFTVVKINTIGAGYALTFKRLKDCAEHARMYCGIHDTFAPLVYGYSAKTGALYCFGYDQLPFRFRAFRID